MASYDIFNHEFLYWFGDLNYRIDVQDIELVHLKIQERDWPFLLAKDQLLHSRSKGLAFDAFDEGTIKFGPTFKYLCGSHSYDRSKAANKQRIPAWCDRILWKGKGVRQLFYRRSELLLSDHKPVSSMFEVQAKVLEIKKKKTIYESLARQLDVWENENIPKVQMSPKNVDFGNVNFDMPITHTLLVDNIGSTVVYFRFCPKTNNTDYCKSWLNVIPDHGTIPPGTSCEIEVRVHVTKKDAQALNCGDDGMDDILILRLENGRDYFVTVSGDYMKSCNGAAVDWLLKTNVPVRFVTDKPEADVLRVPKELWRVVNYIYNAEGGTEGMLTPRLFADPGNYEEIENIREALDTGQEFARNISLHSMAEALVKFLANLDKPIFPQSICKGWKEDARLTPFCKQALTQLPPASYSVFIYVIAFLKECLKHKSKNDLTLDHIVRVFSRAFMQTVIVQKRSCDVLGQFLTSNSIE